MKYALFTLVFAFAAVSFGKPNSQAQAEHQARVWEKYTETGTTWGDAQEPTQAEMAAENIELVDVYEQFAERYADNYGQLMKQLTASACGVVEIDVIENPGAGNKQTLQATCDGSPIFNGRVLTSTGRGGSTPNGTFTVFTRMRHASSARYNNAPMPFALFFSSCGRSRNCIGVHGTVASNYKYLGGMASHGCVRLTFENAQTLWSYASSAAVIRVTVR